MVISWWVLWWCMGRDYNVVVIVVEGGCGVVIMVEGDCGVVIMVEG